MFKKKLLLLLIVILSSIVMADCQYNGTWYPEGQTMGPYICINGQWIRR